ncbi:YhgE/Pip domain-containing protein [Aurantimicrobium sp. MWH-Uga1]|uniref:YhgE/Pip domain-containing protein n=1 Tax=Aurantimicrobium sp. MWH-Uga1 TaxID=2079575 RepID=UPI000DEE030E|nr:YhgE/Pip family protein [Aurantimicrobium sp. MWH-Uga1]AXE54343.1 ABC-2 family transporter protein [Aurantimicrobium sp. MWH-Uga1]
MASLFTRLSGQTETKPKLLVVLGLIFVPLIVVGGLMWGLWNPTERLDRVKAAIVNNDEPVTVNGQITPLGRLLTAGLVKGDGSDTNYVWVITNESGAKKGLENGTYVAAVTIPENFSKVATSAMGNATDATQALIEVTTSEKSRLVDDAITTAITSTAVNLMNQQLTSLYLERVLLGFSDLSEGLSEAAQGSDELTKGIYALADGANQLATGASTFSSGMWALNAQTSQLPSQTQQLATGAATTDGYAQQLSGALGQTAGGLAALSGNTCLAVTSNNQQYCGGLDTISGTLSQQLVPLAAGVAQGTTGVSSGTSALAGGMPALSSGISELAAGSAGIATGISGIASGASALGDGSQKLADGLDEAVANIPTYTEDQVSTLADLVTAPVGIKNGGGLTFGANSTPLYVVLSLWLGALAIFIVLRAIPLRVLESTRSSLSLATRAYGIPAVAAILQAVAVATVIAFAQGYDVAEWASITVVSALISLAFTATNQALVAVLEGFGRLVSLAIGILILVTGVISTVPQILDSILSYTPATEAVTALQAIISEGQVSGFAAAITAMVLWTLGAIAVTAITISRKRHVSITALTRETQPV